MLQSILFKTYFAICIFQLERLPTQNVRDILQQICSAIVFIHHQNFIHCGLSSHAVNLVNPYLAKVGNLEYMIETYVSTEPFKIKYLQ